MQFLLQRQGFCVFLFTRSTSSLLFIHKYCWFPVTSCSFIPAWQTIKKIQMQVKELHIMCMMVAAGIKPPTLQFALLQSCKIWFPLKPKNDCVRFPVCTNHLKFLMVSELWTLTDSFILQSLCRFIRIIVLLHDPVLDTCSHSRLVYGGVCGQNKLILRN